MYRQDEIEYSENEAGETLATLEIDSNTLPDINVDTYSCFNGDSWAENFLEYQGEQGEPSDYDAYEWDYDHSDIIKDLAEASASEILNQLGTDGIIESIEVLSTYSPREYNFTSDSYKARYTLNLAKLDAWATENKFNAEEYASEHHASGPGFFSFVPRYLDDPATREGCILWLKFAAYMRAELNTEQHFYAVADAEHEAYDSNTTITPRADWEG